MAISIERVEPADLIRAAYFNDLADAIETLDVRLSALEAGGGGDGGDDPVITDIDPDEPTERGVMRIIGRNFAVPASLNTITLDGEELTGVLPGSNDELLRVTVPAGIPGLPKNMTLRVETPEGTASRTVRIQPEVELPSGRPTITNITTGIGTIVVGNTYTFLFHIDANTVSISETYRLEAHYSNVVGASEQDWENATSFVGTSNDEVTVAPATPVDVGVSITIPAGATSVSLTLRAVSTHNDPDSSASSLPVPIVVGQDQPENDPRISLFLGEVVANMEAVEDDGELVLRIAYPSGAATRTVLVPIEARFAASGTYAYSAEIEDPGTFWTRGTITPASTGETAGGAQQVNVQVTLRVSSPSNERRNLVFTATRQETTGIGQISAQTTLPIEGFTPA